MRLLSSAAYAVALAFCIPGIAVAQNQNQNQAQTQEIGSIAGVVHDSTGAVIPGATITVTNDRGVAQTATADENGNYLISGLPAGTYKVTISATGFKPFEVSTFVLTAGQVGRVEGNMEIAGATTSINVQGQRTAQVETETPAISGTITQQEVTSIGLNGRNFTQLITLAPGVSNQTGQDEALVGMKGSVKYSVNGGRVEYNNFDVDGSDVLNAGVNGSQSTLIVYPSLDAISDVTVLTSNYGAEYGRSASGTVLVTTKSGGAQFHGDAYEFMRNELFNARNFFDIGTRTPLYRRNDFGYTFGGPLFIPNHYNTQKDKTFFFFSQEFRYEKTPTDFNQAVPSLEERAGNFSDVCPFANSGQQVTFKRTAFPDCPAASPSGTPGFLLTFHGNQVPIDQNASLILGTGIIPTPTANTGCNSTILSCYDAAVSTPTYWREELFRIDHNFTPSLKGSVRYIHDAWNTTTTVPQWGYIQNSFPTIQNYFDGPGLDVVTRLTQIISPTFVNDLIFSFTTDHINLTDVNGPGATWMRPAGLTMGSLFPCAKPYPATPDIPCFGNKLPGIVVGGTNAAYGGNGFAVDPSFEPYRQSNPTYSAGDNVSKTIGNHNLQFGAQFVFAQKNEVNPAIGAATGDVQGIVTFSNENSTLTSGNAFADFLAGNIKSFQQDSAQQKYGIRYKTVEPYFQDDWHVTSRLTLNLGLRLSLFGTWYEKTLQAYNWESSAFSPSLAAQAVVDPLSGALLDVPTCADPSNPSATTCNFVPLNPINPPDPRLLNGLVQCGTNGTSRSCMKGHLFNPAPRIGFAWDPRGDGKTSIRAGYGLFFEHGTGDEANIGSLEGSAPPVLDITQNFTPGYECIGGCGKEANAAFPPNVTSIPGKAVWPYVQQWSLSVQRQLTPDLVTSVAYVGSKGTHLTAELEQNQLQPVGSAENPFNQAATVGVSPITPPGPTDQPITLGICDSYTGSTFTINQTTISSTDPGFVNLEAACYGIQGATRQFPDPNSLRMFAPSIGQIFSLQNVGNSHYHALQVTLRRTKAPLSLEVAYSYSHSTDDSSDRFDSTFVNSFDLASNRASSNFDQRHLLNVSYVYQLNFVQLGSKMQDLTNWLTGPVHGDSATKPSPQKGGSSPASGVSGVGASWIGRHLLENWEFSGVSTFQSGTPFSVINGGSAATGVSVLDNAGVANGTGAGSYPDTIGGVLPPLAMDANQAPFTFGPLLDNPNQFIAPRGLTFGDAGRNSMSNPSRLNFDMALLKHFKITESSTLELRAEAFNIFNHTQFRIYDPDRGNTANNTISCYGGPENTAGFVDTTSGGVDCLTGNAFLRPIDAHRPRTIQFGIKLLF